ncbi:transposase [Marinicellulosiphila megalodicopiae]|uniref:transposase n=1 Tax=Marinicellulosiphila megalodicopiae TaxID=2724896 RepID=UPI003BB132E3
MTKARKRLVNYTATTKYLITCRCVRRAFLCGKDEYTNQDFEHRRAWVEDILLKLPSIFAIDIASYAIMNNHYHLVISVNVKQAESWSAAEVIKRWHQLYTGTMISRAFLDGSKLNPQERILLAETVEIWRNRLINIGWFMKNINEPISRLSNIEDNCTGKFWEGRYKSKAILDDEGLLAAMVYVDLNPVRAQMTKTPEESEYTSIKKRSECFKKSNHSNLVKDQPNDLLPLSKHCKTHIQISTKAYLELVDWTGKQCAESKKGKIDSELPDILTRLDLSETLFLNASLNINNSFANLIGKASSIDQHFSKFGLKRACGWVKSLSVLGL